MKNGNGTGLHLPSYIILVLCGRQLTTHVVILSLCYIFDQGNSMLDTVPMFTRRLPHFNHIRHNLIRHLGELLVTESEMKLNLFFWWKVVRNPPGK